MSAIPNITDGILSFAESREQARRTHAESIGAGVDVRKCFADWLLRVRFNDRAGLEKIYGSVPNHEATVVKTALSGNVGGPTGGYLVPVELLLTIMETVNETALIRPRACVVPMATASTLMPLPNAQTVQAAGTSPFFGGMTMNWLIEAQNEATTESEPTFRQVELKANDLVGYALSSRNLMEDAGKGLEAWLIRLFAEAVGWFEDYAFLRGDGLGKPIGMLTTPAAIAVTRNTGSHVKLVDIAGMAAKLLPVSWTRAIWAVHPTVIADLIQLSTSAYIANMYAKDYGPIGTLLTRPVYVTEKLPALGTAGDIMLLDPHLYLIGDRQRMEVDVASYGPAAFATNQDQWRIIQRVDGQPFFQKPITLQDGSTTASISIHLT